MSNSVPLKINVPLLLTIKPSYTIEDARLTSAIRTDKAKSSPSFTSKLTPSSALTPPKVRQRLSTTSFDLLLKLVLSSVSLSFQPANPYLCQSFGHFFRMVTVQ